MRKAEFVLQDQGIGSTLGEGDYSNPEDPFYSIKINNSSDVQKAKIELENTFQVSFD